MAGGPAHPGEKRAVSLSRPAAAMLALPLDACLWPAGEGWCGRQATRGAYCATHYRRSVAPEITDLSPRTIASILRLRLRPAA